MKYSDTFADWLVELGYTQCYFVAGGNIMHILESLSHRMTCTPVVHEVAAAVAAEYFTATAGDGRRALCLVTAGPGVTNALTGVAGAYTESRELLVVGGQVKSTDLAAGGVRQRGIQELDGMALMAPVTKAQLRLNEPLPFTTVEELVSLSRSGRPGPVYVEFCLDTQATLTPHDFDASVGRAVASRSTLPTLHGSKEMQQISDLIRRSERPVLLVGGGVSRSLARSLRKDLLASGLPTATSWNALDRVDWDDPINFGRPDTWGMRWSNLLIQQSDLVIAVGARLSLQQTGFNWQGFAPLAQVVHVDVDDAELGKPHPRKEVILQATAEEFLPWLLVAAREESERWESWRMFGKELKELLPLDEPGNQTSPGYVSPYAFAGWLSNLMTGDDILVPCSSGAAETVMMQAFRQKYGQMCINNKALASMGYGLAGALGVAGAWPSRRIFLTEGDGGFAQNVQELGTLARLDANLKLFVWDNEGYASIRMTQQRYFGGNYLGCDPQTGLGLPAWHDVFKAFGIASMSLHSLDGSDARAVAEAVRKPGPLAVVVSMDPNQTYFPKIDSVVHSDGTMRSAALHEMTPPLVEELAAIAERFLRGK